MIVMKELSFNSQNVANIQNSFLGYCKCLSSAEDYVVQRNAHKAASSIGKRYIGVSKSTAIWFSEMADGYFLHSLADRTK